MKPRDDARALIDEGQRFLVVHPFELGGRVARRLLLDRRDLVAPFFGFGLDHADCLLINEKHIVGWAGIGLIFANGDARTGMKSMAFLS